MAVLEDNGMGKRVFPLYAEITHDDLIVLSGRVLTLLDASISDEIQRKALKDIFKQMFWFGWVENLEGRVDREIPVGSPNEFGR